MLGLGAALRTGACGRIWGDIGIRHEILDIRY